MRVSVSNAAIVRMISNLPSLFSLLNKVEE